jgi:CHAT domain-containing protein
MTLRALAWFSVPVVLVVTLIGNLSAQDTDLTNKLTGLMQQAHTEEANGNFEKQLKLYQEVLASIPEAFGENSPQEAAVRNNIALTQHRLGMVREAQKSFSEALEFSEKVYGPESPKLNAVLTGLGRVHQDLGEYEKTESYFRRAIKNCSTPGGVDHKGLCYAWNNLAELKSLMGDYAEAEKCYRESVAQAAKAWGENSELALEARIQFGGFLIAAGQLEKASQELLGVQKVLSEQKAPNRLLRTKLKGALIELDIKLFNLELAETALREHIEELRSLFPNGSPELFRARLLLGKVLLGLKNYEGAEIVFAQVLRELEKNLDMQTQALSMVDTLSNLSIAQKMRGKKKESHDSLMRAIELDKKWLPTSLTTYTLRWNLEYGRLLEGQFAEVEASLRELEKEISSNLGPEHPLSILFASGVARSLHGQQKMDEAVQWYSQLRRRSFSDLSANLFSQYEYKQWYLFENQDRELLYRVLQFATDDPKSQKIQQQAVEWLANSKGLIESIHSNFTRTLRDSPDPRIRDLGQELDAGRRKITATQLAETLAKTSDEKSKWQRETTELERAHYELTLKARGLLDDAQKEISWIDYRSIQQALGKDRCLIDISKLLRVGPSDETVGEARYVAWVTDHNGTEVVDLGPAEEIASLVKSLTDQFDSASDNIAQLGEKKSEELLSAALGKLSEKIVLPILDKISNSKRWEISVDEELWRVPWSALKLPDGKYVVENYEIEMVTGARSLIEQKGKQFEKTRSVVFADPEFGRQVTTISEENALRGLSSDLNLGLISKLAGTMRDARVMTLAFTKLLGGEEPQVFTGENASTENFYQIRNPRYLLIATHGFYLPYTGSYLNVQDPSQIFSKEDDQEGSLSTMVDPLLRSGLLFAGCNLQNALDVRSVVTARDVKTIDLAGCELVLLSSCESGLGEYRFGAGIAGLRQAFLLAGAQRVISSLWNVSDRYTSVLMEGFGREFAATNDGVRALNIAQREMINRLKENRQSPHPFYWAAFVITR